MIKTLSLLAIWLGWLLPAPAAEVLTQHNDQFRSGANLHETVLKPSNVNPGQFGKLFSYAVDGYVYAQPLYVAGLAIAGGRHNVVFVATMEDSIYAFDADSNKTYWHKQFTGGDITPVPIVDIAGVNNSNIHGDVGILSTPVIDRATSTIYLLARTKNTASRTYYQALHALDLATGAEKFGGPSYVDAPGFDPKLHNQRPGLGLFNGKIYICWGSHEDIKPYHGWMMSFNATTLTVDKVFNTTPGGSEGAIWTAGQAPAFDRAGNVYVTTGNGDWNGTTQWGQTCLKLSPALSVLDWFTVDDYADMNRHDTDFGASGCLLLPGSVGYPSTSYVLTGGKDGRLFVLDAAGHMGHKGPRDANAYQMWQAVQNSHCSNHIHGSPIYWESKAEGKMIYLWGENDVGKAYKFDGTKFNPTPFTKTEVTSPTTGCGMPGSILSLSANGGSDGIVWANSVYTGDAVHDIVPGVLRAYDANNLGVELWNSRQNKARDDFGKLAKYVAPTVANGKVYMATFSKTVCVYGPRNPNDPTVGDPATEAGSAPDGAYKIVNRHSHLALAVAGGSADNSVAVVQEAYTGAESQQWTLTRLEDGSYKIVGLKSGKALDVTGNSGQKGALIDIYPYKGQNNQQWEIEAAATKGFFTIKGVGSAMLLDIPAGSTDPGTKVQQYESNGAEQQEWSLEKP